MESIVTKAGITEEEIISAVLSSPQSLSSSIWELEKLQTAVTQRIQLLAGNYHENILNHQSSLQSLGGNIKNLLEKAQHLQQRTCKLGNELEQNLEKMNENVMKLEKVQKAGEMIRLAQQFCMKVKKSRNSENKEIGELANKLKGLTVIEKMYREREENLMRK